MKIDISPICRNTHQANCRHILIAAFGYESRAAEYTKKYSDQYPKGESALVSFSDYVTGDGRQSNDIFLQSQKLDSICICSNEYDRYVEFIDDKLKTLQASTNQICIHVDYSCMPRSWYCSLIRHLTISLRIGDQIEAWYTPGHYNEKAFSPTGIEDFDVFDGIASLRPRARTHILGLGFESGRTQAIMSVIDPKFIVCYYAHPGVDETYSERVIEENKRILSVANRTASLPLSDIASAYCKLRSIVLDYEAIGDVILIPDGPKPLVLAASLIPMSIDKPGITCLHVRRRARDVTATYDVISAGAPIGFRIERSTSG